VGVRATEDPYDQIFVGVRTPGPPRDQRLCDRAIRDLQLFGPSGRIHISPVATMPWRPRDHGPSHFLDWPPAVLQFDVCLLSYGPMVSSAFLYNVRLPVDIGRCIDLTALLAECGHPTVRTLQIVIVAAVAVACTLGFMAASDGTGWAIVNLRQPQAPARPISIWRLCG
jgi:hypothetical protein